MPAIPGTTAFNSTFSILIHLAFQFGVAYTYSRSTDNGSSLTDVFPSAYDAHGYYGLSDFDRPHVVVANYMYDLSFFKTGNAFSHSPDHQRYATSFLTALCQRPS